ncbi:glutamate [NMDA] receptor subunit 1-like isoform X3 [Rhopilema esculentum]|uniref:glutamate [NMDA] receptor subunit 1-like isoform X3 n=1 Tax=Rhopilema esculentum TaxID=499914 RepID=UPI0031DE7410|eukprot:gene13268-4101_t
MFVFNRGSLESFFAAFFALLTTTSCQDVSFFGIIKNQSGQGNFQNASEKLNITESSFYSNWNSNYGLSFVISQMGELRTKINRSDSSKNIVFSDTQGMQSEMVKELLLIQEDMTSPSYNKTVIYDDCLGGNHQRENHHQMAKDMLSFLNTLVLPFEDITIVTDWTETGQAILTQLIQSAYHVGRDTITIQSVEKLIADQSSVSSTFLDCKLFLVDCDGALAAKMFDIAKSMGLTGFKDSVRWILSGRTMESLPQSCSIPRGEYYGRVPSQIALNGSYILRKVKQYIKEDLMAPNCSKRASEAKIFKPLSIRTNAFGNMWKEDMEMYDYMVSMIINKQGLNPNAPKLRVSVVEFGQFVMVYKYNETSESNLPCQISGKLGIKRRPNASYELVCMNGFTIDILKELEAILGFVGIPMLTEDGKFGGYNSSTGETVGYIRDLVRNETDISIDLYLDKRRSQIIGFTAPYYIGSMGFAYMQKNQYEEAAVLKPFSRYLWLCFIGTMIVLIVVLWSLERVSPYSQHQINKRSLDDTKEFTFVDSVIYVWGTFFTGEIISNKAMAVGSRSIAIVVSFVSILVMSAYSANLISFLLVLDETPLVTGLLDEKLIKSSSKLLIGVQESTYPDYFLLIHNDSRVRSMSKTRVKRYPSLKDSFKALINRDVDLVINDFDALAYEASHDKNCTMKAMPLNEKEMGFAVSYNNKSTWKRRLNMGAMDLAHSGKADSLAKKWFTSSKCTHASNFSALDVTRMKDLFIWLSTGIAGCLGILVVTVWLQKCEAFHKKMTEPEDVQGS